MTPRTGRPKSDDPRDRTAITRMTEAEYAACAAAASKAGLTLGAWMRARLLAAAKRSTR